MNIIVASVVFWASAPTTTWASWLVPDVPCSSPEEEEEDGSAVRSSQLFRPKDQLRFKKIERTYIIFCGAIDEARCIWRRMVGGRTG